MRSTSSEWVIDSLSLAGLSVKHALGVGTAHQLRHSFATSCYRAERDLLAVQRLLGHSEVSTTMCYVALDGDALYRSVAAASIGSA